MCSWCWGFRETLVTFQQNIGDAVHWQYIMGGLAPDSDEPMPEDMQQYIQGHWQSVAQRSAAAFNFDFWKQCTPRRSSYPACRAVIAAGLQGEEHKSAMIYAIQKAYYLEARNPSDIDTLSNCAIALGLNGDQFSNDMQSNSLKDLFLADLNRCREWGIGGFPCLVYQHGDNLHMLSNGFTNLDSLTQRWQSIQS